MANHKQINKQTRTAQSHLHEQLSLIILFIYCLAQQWISSKYAQCNLYGNNEFPQKRVATEGKGGGGGVGEEGSLYQADCCIPGYFFFLLANPTNMIVYQLTCTMGK